MKSNVVKILKKILRANYIRKIKKNYNIFFNKCNRNISCYDTTRALPKDVERDWLRRYYKIDKNANIKSLRIFSHYIKNVRHIIPYDTYQAFIGPVLNPVRFNYFYEDKNNLDIILPKGFTTETVLRRIEGIYKDKDYSVLYEMSIAKVYELFQRFDNLVVKQSYISGGGKSVVKLTKRLNKWFVGERELSIDFLNNFSSNFIVQSYLKQSNFISQFCSSSVNTLRVITYRSVKTNDISVLAVVLRIGKQGCVTDNISTGGKAVRINSDGSFAKELFDYYGNISTEINGIDLKNTNYVLPNYNALLDFSIRIASFFHHSHLLALDIAMDENDNPVLIEVNIGGFSLDIPYFAHFDMFGNSTEEVLEFVEKNSKPHLFSIKI